MTDGDNTRIQKLQNKMITNNTKTNLPKQALIRIPVNKSTTGLPTLENAFTITVSFLNSDIEAYVFDSDTYESLTKRVSSFFFNSLTSLSQLSVILGADFEELNQEHSDESESEDNENDPFRLWRLIGFLPRSLLCSPNGVSAVASPSPRKKQEDET